jgi:hypothetical protein
LYNTNPFRVSTYDDGRIQLGFASGQNWRVVTFNENGIIEEDKSTDGGSNFTSLWRADFIKDITIRETVITSTTIEDLPADTGKSWSALTGNPVSVEVPDGYTLVGKVNVVINGLIGATASFDGVSQHTSITINPFIFNGRTTANYTAGMAATIRVYSLIVKF